MANMILLQDIAQRVNFSLENTQKLLDIFYESTHTLLNRLDEAIEANDYDTIYRSSHSLKGSASNLLFDDIYAITKELEAAAKEKQPYEYSKKVEEIRYILQHTQVI
jgi:HPt (histidine-containing phosphotransfer) domain-containing protein